MKVINKMPYLLFLWWEVGIDFMVNELPIVYRIKIHAGSLQNEANQVSGIQSPGRSSQI